MGNSPVDRDQDFMKSMWGTTSLTSDYWSLPHETEDPEEKSDSEDHARRFEEGTEESCRIGYK